MQGQVLKFTTQPIDFHPIPTLPFKEILKPEYRCFDINSSEFYHGRLRVDTNPRSLIGAGGFKTAQPAQLVLSTLRTSGLGSRPCEDVAVKRPYIRRQNPEGKPPFPRYAIADKLEMLFREANVLYWAKALLSMTYTFIDRALVMSAEPPSFDIPRIRFVDAGLAIGYANTSAVGGPKAAGRKAGTADTAYLVEELIPDAGYEVAEFLAFTQHVQYFKTAGLAYISDYQGSTSLLTDPQILTHPFVGEGANIFCEGNLEKKVEQFEEEHVCNKFCKWPGFKLAAFESSGVNMTSRNV